MIVESENKTKKSQENGDNFNSSIGLIFSCLGCVVGTGNIWRFPRIAAQNSASDGSLTFLITWIIFLFIWSSPMILIEYAMGRYSKVSPVQSFRFFLGEKALFMGGWTTAVTFIISCYYSVVLGWCFYYFYYMIANELPKSEVLSSKIFYDYIESYWPILTHAISIFLSGLCVMGGVSWIEKANMALVPLLLVILIFTFGWAMTQPYADYGIRYLFTPSWPTILDPKLWVDAASQNAFDTGAAMGLFASYATYMKPENGVVKYAVLIPLINNIVSLLCAITIFSTVFSTLITNRPILSQTNIVEIIKDAGPGSTGLTFIWIPVLFSEFGTVGRVLAVLFFFCLSCAGISSLISNVELTAKTLVDFGVARRIATPLCIVVQFLIGLASALSIEFLKNQDFVWGFALMISGLMFQFLVILYGARKFQRVVVNEYGTDDWHLPFIWVIIVHVIAPLEAIGLLVWWGYGLISTQKEFYVPTTESFMTTILEWVGVMLILILLNIVIVYVRPAWLDDTIEIDEDRSYDTAYTDPFANAETGRSNEYLTMQTQQEMASRRKAEGVYTNPTFTQETESRH